MTPKHVLLLESESEDNGNDVGKHDSFSSNEDEDKGVDVETVDLDEYLKRGGEFGKYQIWVVMLMMIVAVPMAMPILMFYFIGFDPQWSCTENVAADFCRNKSDWYDHGNTKRCSLPRSSWRYQNSGRTTLVTDFDLICGKSWWNALIGSVVFIGWGIGSLVMGSLSDRYGRKRVMFPSYFICLLCSFLHAFVYDIYRLLILRLLMGFFFASPALNSYVLLMEIVGPNRRTLLTAVTSVGFPLGGIMLVIKAYFIKSWRLLVIACSAPYFATVLLGICIPESVRWLSLKGRTKDAEKILQRAAIVNKRIMPPLALAPIQMKKNSASYLDLFSSCNIIKIVLVQVLMWFNCGMTYYTLSWAFADLGGDMFINLIVSLLLEIPGHLFSNILMHRVGRKKTTVGMIFGTVVFCVGIAVIPKSTDVKVLRILRVVLGLTGKLMIGNAFGCIYLWSSEIYPTIVRTQGMGINIITSRAGAATSPFIKVLDQLHPSTPFATVALTSFIAALCSLTLPETLSKPTRETLGDFSEDKHSIELKILSSVAEKSFETSGKALAEDNETDEYADDEREEETDHLLVPTIKVLSAGKL